MMDPRRLVHGNMLLFGGGGEQQLFIGGGGGGGIFGGEEIGGGGGGVRRRPFFGTVEDMMMEEEYYDEQLTHEKKRRLTPEQVHALEVSFEVENKLEPERKSELAKKLGLQPRQVAIWFQNRRARWKTKQLERDFDRLKSSYDSLLTDHDSLLADNQRLRSEVVLLMEKLENKKSVVVSRPDSTIVASLDTIESIKVMVDHPSIGSGNSLPAFEEDEGTLHVDNSITSYYPEPEDGVSYNGGGIVSSEEEGSDSGGAYFPGIFTDENVVMEQQQQQLVSEDNAISWWAWE